MKLGHFSKPLHVINLLSKETLGGRCISDPGNTCPKIESKGIFEENPFFLTLEKKKKKENFEGEKTTCRWPNEVSGATFPVNWGYIWSIKVF